MIRSARRLPQGGSLSGLLAAALLLAPALASAHYRGTSYSDWTIAPDGVSVRARVSQLELTRLQLDPASTPDYAAQVGDRLREDLQLWSASGRCDPGAAVATPTEDGWISAQWSLHCPALPRQPGEEAANLIIRSNLFLAVAPSHLHFARVEIAGGQTFERVLTYSDPSVSFAARDASMVGASKGDASSSASTAAASNPGSTFLRYVKLGIEHILSGWDHMAFVLALILLAARVREVALLATGFTAAHSLTLAAAVLGWVDVQPPAIEALIGFSIAIVAAENLWQRAGRERWVPALFVLVLLAFAALGAHGAIGAHGAPYGGIQISAVVLMGLALFTASYFALVERVSRPLRLRIAVAFLFGLVHGFGFAGAMTPLHLAHDRLATALVGFNSGVELGQLAVIATVWPLLKLLSRAPNARLWAGDVASACICGLGVFWFVTRAFGGIS